MRRRLLLLGMSALYWQEPARSTELRTGVGSATSMPSELAAELPNAIPAGAARMRYFGLQIYDARLWVSPGFQPAMYWQAPLALELRYLRSLHGPAIAQRSLDEMRRHGPINEAQAQAWLHAMKDVFPNVHHGDRITGLHSPGNGARFWLNGVPRPAIRDAEFSRLFFGIWLAESTSEPLLRTELLSRLAP
jgi:hypothetical protein